MKRLLIFVTAVLLLGACEVRNSPNDQSTDEYYVKYSIKSSWYKFGNVSYGDVDGTKHDLIEKNVTIWSVTIGPVKKGFRAWSSNSSGTSTNSANHTIEVNKNGGPFAQKATGINSASYIINF